MAKTHQEADMIRGRFYEGLQKRGVALMSAEDMNNALPKVGARSGGGKPFNPSSAFCLAIHGDRMAFIYPHVRSEAKGFWAIANNNVEKIEALLGASTRMIDHQWYLVLLLGRLKDDQKRGMDFVADGWIIADPRSKGMLDRPSADGSHFHINESQLKDPDQVLGLLNVVDRLIHEADLRSQGVVS